MQVPIYTYITQETKCIRTLNLYEWNTIIKKGLHEKTCHDFEFRARAIISVIIIGLITLTINYMILSLLYKKKYLKLTMSTKSFLT